MDPARRFTPSQAREVFARAAAAQDREDRLDADLGLTAAELAAAGAEAGIDPVHVAAAARAVASGEPDDGRESLAGVPTGVRRAVTLDGPPSDAAWDRLVLDVRETFDAVGTTERVGDARVWRNGNLRAVLEPSGPGARFRLQTHRRGDTRLLLGVGGVNALLAVLFALTPFQSNGPESSALALLGFALLAYAWVRQTTWVRRRERQMDAVAGRAQRAARPGPLAAGPLRALDLGALDPDARPDGAVPEARPGRSRSR